ncbi:arginase [Desulfosporosinus sp. BICA1-9]|uniref:arginase n=1 Tax=Desulfosporosinus sp. BICA1-9 TaxID=1531958 RepID=UPI00054BC4DB|nr:arginase [Desulfosporosinus sp. BICA1-9]KJS78234.1 MAG: arginase [Desulfosporosinus sp. BICA1-9]HBW38384.1 arginase [Desulfosporosinus sp.]
MNVDVIGVPIDLGANRRGVDMGPSAIRYGGLKKAITNLNIGYKDIGNIDVPIPESYDDFVDESFKNEEEIGYVNKSLASLVRKSLLEGNLPIILGGDHSIAVGSILGTQSVLENIGVLWIDAHGDFNTRETTLSGNLHGMSLAASAGFGALEMTGFKPKDVNYVNPKKVVLIGARDIDNEEAILIKESGITVFTMSDIDEYGMKEVMVRALEIVAADTEGFHVSFDLDVMNPNEAPGVGTPVNGGLTFREAHLAAEMISNSKKLRSLEVVELNPILDHMNQTGKLAVSLICSMIGKRILG